MPDYEGAEHYLPDELELPRLRTAAATCQGCDLYRNATQTVFGAGGEQARMVMVGEQPGDREDLSGEPFVGPAGALLDKALVEAGIDREEVYVTNAVKHFRFVPPERGKRRLHQKPTRAQIAACRPWLLAELEVVRPDLVVFLGATAAQSVLGTSFKVSVRRGELLDLAEEAEVSLDPVPRGLATVHPSSILRARDEARADAYRELVEDLCVAAKAL
ncbi:DNA polymerase [Amycolatopsis arida]|uniref:Type-4 uracil-DNA glycosylase n=1 Tax=Amycolatopsis arida TaxID=587909 RepID=A0A1I5L3H3_9PSEU|nr:UdgX family uracil-DNA binding protein [Amycolatopsis arida]TDX93570.1 DNA polymerase [Amycolatopsis arida]SFO91844.1 DNA polymerase [Amycolatopsis arida]